VGKGGAHGRSQPDHPALLALWRSRAWDEAIRNTEARNGSAVHQDLCERAAHSSAVRLVEEEKRRRPARECDKWNFTKFLIGADGTVLDRFPPTTGPEAIAPRIDEALGAATPAS
jgi:hypothetical protein